MMLFDDFWPCDEYQSLAWQINDASKTENEGGYCLDWDEEALEIMKTDTRHYAKRQMTFIRSRKDFAIFENATAEDILKFLEEYDG